MGMGLFSKGFNNDEKAMILDCFVWGAMDNWSEELMPKKDVDLNLLSFVVSKCEPKKHYPAFTHEIIEILLAGVYNSGVGKDDAKLYPNHPVESFEKFREMFIKYCETKEDTLNFVKSGMKFVTIGFLAFCYGVFYVKKDIKNDTKTFGNLYVLLGMKNLMEENLKKSPELDVPDYVSDWKVRTMNDYRLESETLMKLSLFNFFDLSKRVMNPNTHERILPDSLLDGFRKQTIDMWKKRENVQELIDEFLTDSEFKNFIDKINGQ